MTQRIQPPQIGIIGLGQQGSAIAHAAVDAGWQLRAWARRPESLDVLQDIAFRPCPSAGELGAACDIVLLCLPDDDAVDDVLGRRGLLAAMRPGSVLVNHGAGSPELASVLADRGEAVGVRVLDAPACGGLGAAQARALTTIVGGEAAAFEACEALFEAYSPAIRYVGPAGAGQLSRLVNSAALMANLDGAREVVAVAGRMGVAIEELSDLILDARAISPFGIDLALRPRQAGLSRRPRRRVPRR